MEKSIIYVIIYLSMFQAVSCKKEKAQPSNNSNTQTTITSTTFKMSDLDSSLWILKGRFKDGVYVKTHAEECGCNQNTGFVLNYKTDTIPYNKGKYYTYLISLADSSDNQGAGSWMPIDSIFNGWPTGKSDYFQQYTIISLNKDSLVVDDGTPFTSNGEYSIYMNHSELLK